MYVVDLDCAQRYLIRCCVSENVIERVLLKPPYKRRVYGEHDVLNITTAH